MDQPLGRRGGQRQRAGRGAGGPARRRAGRHPRADRAPGRGDAAAGRGGRDRLRRAPRDDRRRRSPRGPGWNGWCGRWPCRVGTRRCWNIPSACRARAASWCCVPPRAGWVQRLDARAIGQAATLLGAGRLRKEDQVDPAVGITLHAKQGEAVRRGGGLATLWYNDPHHLGGGPGAGAGGVHHRRRPPAAPSPGAGPDHMKRHMRHRTNFAMKLDATLHDRIAHRRRGGRRTPGRHRRRGGGGAGLGPGHRRRDRWRRRAPWPTLRCPGFPRPPSPATRAG